VNLLGGGGVQKLRGHRARRRVWQRERYHAFGAPAVSIIEPAREKREHRNRDYAMLIFEASRPPSSRISALYGAAINWSKVAPQSSHALEDFGIRFSRRNWPHGSSFWAVLSALVRPAVSMESALSLN
jgi:hypothetical protein